MLNLKSTLGRVVLIIAVTATTAAAQKTKPPCDPASVQASAANFETRPVLISMPTLRFPLTLQNTVKTGQVSVSFVVDAKGRVEKCSMLVVFASDSAFIPNATSAVMNANFKPGLIAGKAQRTLGSLDILFSNRRPILTPTEEKLPSCSQTPKEIQATASWSTTHPPTKPVGVKMQPPPSFPGGKVDDSARVRLSFVVDPKGIAEPCSILVESSYLTKSDSAFAKSAIAMILKSKFTPAMDGEVAVRMLVTQSVNFSR